MTWGPLSPGLGGRGWPWPGAARCIPRGTRDGDSSAAPVGTQREPGAPRWVREGEPGSGCAGRAGMSGSGSHLPLPRPRSRRSPPRSSPFLSTLVLPGNEPGHRSCGAKVGVKRRAGGSAAAAPKSARFPPRHGLRRRVRSLEAALAAPHLVRSRPVPPAARLSPLPLSLTRRAPLLRRGDEASVPHPQIPTPRCGCLAAPRGSAPLGVPSCAQGTARPGLAHGLTWLPPQALPTRLTPPLLPLPADSG